MAIEKDIDICVETQKEKAKLTFIYEENKKDIMVPMNILTATMINLTQANDLYDVFDMSFIEDGTVVLNDTLDGISYEMLEEDLDEYFAYLQELIVSDEVMKKVEECKSLVNLLVEYAEPLPDKIKVSMTYDEGLSLDVSTIKSYFINGINEKNTECIERGFEKLSKYIIEQEQEQFPYQHGIIKMINQLKGKDSTVDERLLKIKKYVEGDAFE